MHKDFFLPSQAALPQNWLGSWEAGKLEGSKAGKPKSMKDGADISNGHIVSPKHIFFSVKKIT